MSKLLTVLIVDDETNIRNGIRYIMNWKNEGFEVIGEAENGIDALNQIKKREPDVVITDLKMPRMDGIELTQIIKEKYPDIDFFILSSYDDFQSVSQSFKNGAVDYILKPTLTKDILLENLNKIKMNTTLNNKPVSKKIILQESLNRFLSGYDKTTLNQFSDYLEMESYFLIYSNLDYTEDSHFLNNIMEKIATAPFVHQSIKFLTNNIDTGIIISVNGDTDIKKELHELLHQEKLNDTLFHLLVSQEITNIETLYPIFNNFSLHSNEQLFFFKNTKIIFNGDLLALEDIEKFEISKFLKELLDNNFLLSLSRIEVYFNNLILFTAAPYVMKQQASSIFYTLISRIEEENYEADLHSIKINFIQTINELNYLEDFSEFILNNISKIRVILAEHIDSDDSTLSKIKQYIHENYQENLSLADLSDKFHFNYNYLSVLLSANLNMSFPDYLKKIRMEEAKKMLVHSDLSLSKISLAVGYSDLSYFSKLFKKDFNITPSKYRRAHKQ